MTRAPGTIATVVEGTPEFEAILGRLARRGEADLSRVEPAVRDILDAIRTEGDPAVRRFVERFEQRQVDAILVEDYGGAEALARIDPKLRRALELSRSRVAEYHARQAEQLHSFSYEAGGVTLASRVTPLARVGIYAPGGKACYPSSVLMSAVIAKVAGVAEIYLASPDTSDEVRAACHLAGVRALIDAGGAQAIGAMAYGTQTVPKVDKIVGPGNLFVAAAKRLVFGEVDIDSIAGPSEILVIADAQANAAHIAADLLSQAEHDEDAYPLLLTTDRGVALAAADEVAKQLRALPEFDSHGRPRRQVAVAAVENNGVALVVDSEARLIHIANVLAAEHVSVQTAQARELAARILRAGAVFIGGSTPEAAGDYMAGPSHVLPTGGAARYAAPLGVYDFVSRSSLIEYTPEALRQQSDDIATFARAEGLEAHARAVEIRTKT
ncbi:MAG TPA: histidinol dehydrogenase [Polyangiaceae bacterium]|nr:histidinol dehydrogenase [Polyangiaceae bacterium]